MRVVSVVLLMACLASVVSAQLIAQSNPNEEPAIMTKPAAHLKKPIIFSPVQVGAAAVDVDAPLQGTPPATLKPAVVTPNIFGGVVEWENTTAPNGCPCKRQVPEKFRYDARFRNPQVTQVNACGCNVTVAPPTPESLLPPVVARLYPLPVNTTVAPCNNTAPVPFVEKITPRYYPAQPTVAAPTPCPAPPRNRTHVEPHFYGENKVQRAARRAEMKARRQARRARRAARRAAAAKAA